MSSSSTLARRSMAAAALVVIGACGSDRGVAPNPTLDIGESLTRTGPQTTALAGGSSGADYVVAVVNTAAPGGARESFTLLGTGLGAPSASLARSGSPSLVLVPQNEGAPGERVPGRTFEAGMEGDLTAESEVGVGSRFVLTLPGVAA